MKKINKYRFGIISVLLFSLVMYLCGCYSSYTTSIEPEQVPNEKEYEFVNLKLKDSTNVNLKDKGAKYFEVLRETHKVIAVNDVDKNSFVFKKDSVKVHPVILKLYRLSEVSGVEIEKQRFNPLKSTLIIIGVVAVLVLLLVSIVAIDGANGGGGWSISF